MRKDGDTDPLEQYVWDIRYVHAPVLRWQDANDDGEPGDDEETVYYTNDANMNVTALVDGSDGDVVERYMYSPYGEVAVLHGDRDSSGTDTSASEWSARTSNTFENALLYCGYYHDSETGLYHVRNRYYHPPLGRWTSRDPTGYRDGASLYEMVRGSPIQLLDPLGLQAGNWKWVTKEGEDIYESEYEIEVEEYTQRLVGLFMPKRAMLGYTALSGARFQNDTAIVTGQVDAHFRHFNSFMRFIAKGWSYRKADDNFNLKFKCDPDTGEIRRAGGKAGGGTSSDGPLNVAAGSRWNIDNSGPKEHRVTIDVEIIVNVGGTVTKNVSVVAGVSGGIEAGGKKVKGKVGGNIGVSGGESITHSAGMTKGPFRTTYVLICRCVKDEDQEE